MPTASYNFFSLACAVAVGTVSAGVLTRTVVKVSARLEILNGISSKHPAGLLLSQRSARLGRGPQSPVGTGEMARQPNPAAAGEASTRRACDSSLVHDVFVSVRGWFILGMYLSSLSPVPIPFPSHGIPIPSCHAFMPGPSTEVPQTDF
ncbi:hypothetical protein LZ30DRAFT_103933 [Colletotrichum cereale]|nr:hypothetical protein LZ30DRAFT_103933 [Colletotrichum cereale]